VGEALATQFSDIDLQPILDLLTLHAEVVFTDTLPEPACGDPDDDKFLACALACGVRHIISGDRHLLNASGDKGLKVVSPRRFVDDYL
jgi:predicted nucleic acid-binding protein